MTAAVVQLDEFELPEDQTLGQPETRGHASNGEYLMDDNGSVIEWCDPPRSKTNGRWANVVEELKQHPGQWALICRAGHRGTGTLIKRLDTHIEITMRSVPGKTTVDIYARWVGEQ